MARVAEFELGKSPKSRSHFASDKIPSSATTKKDNCKFMSLGTQNENR